VLGHKRRPSGPYTEAPMRLGLALPHYDTSLGGAPASWAGVRRTAELAEGCGWDSVWVSDHLFLDWSKYGGSADAQGSLECWTTLAALAAVTSRVRLGSLALCNDLRNPALVAKMAATLDLLSAGRLELGLGAGWYEPEYRAAGLGFSSPAARIRRLGEAVTIITRLLEGEELSYEGQHYSVSQAICRPGPYREPRPPVWICGKGDLLLETAARVADGWNFSWLGDLDLYRSRARVADVACDKVGRDPHELRRSVGAYVLVGKDEADARRRFERLKRRTPAGVLRSARGGGSVSWEGFKRSYVAGAVSEVIDTLGRLEALGVEEVIVSLGALPFQLAHEEDIEFVGAEVGPALR
jgi:probable F420-dependent oxidoreductase